MNSVDPNDSRRNRLIELLLDWLPLIVLVSVVLTSFVVYTSMRYQIIFPAWEKLEEIANTKEQTLTQWFEQRRDKILRSKEALEESSIVREALKQSNVNSQESQAIKRLLADFNLLESRSVALLNRGSIIRYSTDSDREGRYLPIQNVGTYLMPNTEAEVVPNFYVSPSDDIPTITLVVPLRNFQDKRLGFLAVDLNLDDLATKVRQSPYRQSFYQQSLLENYLVARISPEANAFVTPPSNLSDKFEESVNSEGIERAILEQKTGEDLYLNYNDEPVIGHYRWIPKYNFAFLSEFNQYEIFQPARNVAAWIYGIGLSLTIILSIILYFIKSKSRVSSNASN